MPSKTASIGIETTGATALKRAMRVLGEVEAPFLREAVEDGGKKLQHAVQPRAPGGMGRKVEFVKISGKGANVKALVRVTHPGAKAMEFGRTTYYEGFQGRRQKATGHKVKRRGQQARPFVGVRNLDHAIGSVKDGIRRTIEEAFEKEWDRITSAGDAGGA